MPLDSQIWLEREETDEIVSDAADAELNTSVHLDAETGRIAFQATWADVGGTPAGVPLHTVELVLDRRVMERYADLDAAARRRIHTMLHDTVQRTVDCLPAQPGPCALVVEITDAMLDAAIHPQ
ncbi:hypothetical protein [Burkholderia stagnalis]